MTCAHRIYLHVCGYVRGVWIHTCTHTCTSDAAPSIAGHVRIKYTCTRVVVYVVCEYALCACRSFCPVRLGPSAWLFLLSAMAGWTCVCLSICLCACVSECVVHMISLMCNMTHTVTTKHTRVREKERARAREKAHAHKRAPARSCARKSARERDRACEKVQERECFAQLNVGNFQTYGSMVPNTVKLHFGL